MPLSFPALPAAKFAVGFPERSIFILQALISPPSKRQLPAGCFRLSVLFDHLPLQPHDVLPKRRNQFFAAVGLLAFQPAITDSAAHR